MRKFGKKRSAGLSSVLTPGSTGRKRFALRSDVDLLVQRQKSEQTAQQRRQEGSAPKPRQHSKKPAALKAAPTEVLKKAAAFFAALPAVLKTVPARIKARLTGTLGELETLSFNKKVALVSMTLGCMLLIAGIIMLSVVGSRRVEVHLNYDDNRTTLLAFSTETVADALEQQQIVLLADDKVVPRASTPLEDGMVITISRGMDITISLAESEHQVVLTQGTVSDALTAAGIEFDEYDIIDPLPILCLKTA